MLLLANSDGLPLSVRCWIRGTDPEVSLTVHKSQTACVNDIKNAIEAAFGKNLGGSSPDRLNLYKISVDEEDDIHENHGALGSGRRLLANELLKNVFDDVPFSQTPCVVIELLDKSKQNYGGVDSYLPGLQLLIAACGPAAIPSVVHPKLQYIQALAHSLPRSLSQQGEPLNFKTFQMTDCRIEWTRPPDSTLRTPVTLFHPVFGQFVDDCDNHEPTGEDNAFGLDLVL